MKIKQYISILLLATIALLLLLLIKSKTEKDDNNYQSDTIIEQITYLQELSLVKYNYSGVIDYQQYLELMNHAVPMTKKSFLMRYTGYVKAGIDMADAWVDVDGKNIKISLPPPKIIETVIDEKSLKTYDETTNLFNPIRLADYKSAIVREKQKISKAAIDKGILITSSKQANQHITKMLIQMGYEKIQITEREPEYPNIKMLDSWSNNPIKTNKTKYLFPQKQ